MVDAKTGTGKHFTKKIIVARLRSEGKIVFIVSSQRYYCVAVARRVDCPQHVPLTPPDYGNVAGFVCNKPAEYQGADLLRASDVITRDKGPMAHLTLQDIIKRKKPLEPNVSFLAVT